MNDRDYSDWVSTELEEDLKDTRFRHNLQTLTG